MSEGAGTAGAGGRPPRAVDVLRRPAVFRWILARITSGAAASMLRATFLWQVWELTRSTAVLGLTGLLSFVPVPLMSLLGGATADAYDRKRVVLAAQAVCGLCAVALFVLAATGVRSTPVLLSLVVLNAAALAFEAPGRQAMLGRLVPAEELSRAVTVMAVAVTVSFGAGPALAGLAIAAWGPTTSYAISAGLFCLSLLLVAGVREGSRGGKTQALSLAGLREALAFLRSRPTLLAAMSLDLFAVIFGGATALLPVYASDVFRVGPRGYGVLSSSQELGAIAIGLALVVLPPIRRLGRAIVLAVVGYGLATVAFGLSTTFGVGLCAYAIAGMADEISVVARVTLVQTETPDELRGRVSSVNMIFIGASNQLSAAEAGFVAALTSPVVSVVSGGAMVLVVVAVVLAIVPSLWGRTKAA